MAANSELEGFEVFEPKLRSDENWIGCVVCKNFIKMTTGSLDVLRWPEYVVVFFDKKGKRMMIVPGKKETPNSIRMTKSYANAKRETYIRCDRLIDNIGKICGKSPKDVRIILYGHQVKVVQPTIIFDLIKIDVKEKNGEEE